VDETGVVRLFERFTVRPGHRADLAAVCGPLVEAIASEPGSLQTCIAVDDTGERAVVVQAFAGRQGLAAHLNNQELLDLTGEWQRHAAHDAVRILGVLPDLFRASFGALVFPTVLAPRWVGGARS
jgi:quinol monooxygenase YgiN